MDLSGLKFDTLLMLMNGIGMVGSPLRLNDFLINAKQLLTKEGILIFDSIDVFETSSPKHVSYRENNILKKQLPGQQKLKINYGGTVGKWFDWLHISYTEATKLAERNGFSSTLLKEECNGQYLAVLQSKI